MNQTCGFNRARPTFSPEVSRRQFLELVVNDRNHGIESSLIAAVNTLQQFRDLHRRYLSAQSGHSKYMLATRFRLTTRKRKCRGSRTTVSPRPHH
jgi:hypothetical protein